MDRHELWLPGRDLHKNRRNRWRDHSRRPARRAVLRQLEQHSVRKRPVRPRRRQDVSHSSADRRVDHGRDRLAVRLLRQPARRRSRPADRPALARGGLCRPGRRGEQGRAGRRRYRAVRAAPQRQATQDRVSHRGGPRHPAAGPRHHHRHGVLADPWWAERDRCPRPARGRYGDDRCEWELHHDGSAGRRHGLRERRAGRLHRSRVADDGADARRDQPDRFYCDLHAAPARAGQTGCRRRLCVSAA